MRRFSFVIGDSLSGPHPTCKGWIGARAEAGRVPPKGFPKSNRFDG